MAQRNLLDFFAAVTIKDGTPTLPVSDDSCRYEYLRLSKRFYIGPGFHDLDMEIGVVSGGVTIGLLNTCGAWRGSVNITKSGHYQLRVGVFWPLSLTRVVIAACNVDAPGPVNVIVSRLALDSWCLRPALLGLALRQAAERLAGRARNIYRTILVPRGYQTLIRGKAVAGRLAQALRSQPLVGNLIHGYHLTDSATIGYASRGLCSLTTPSGLVLITADVGDDSLSVLPVTLGRLQPRTVIKCPSRSAPMYVSRLKYPEGERPVVSLFNFDETGQIFSETSVGLVHDLSAAIRDKKVEPGNGLKTLIKRSGHWGFRGSALHQLSDGRYRLASVDRDRNVFYLLDASTVSETSYSAQQLNIGSLSEPVGIHFAPPSPNTLPTDYYLSCRKAAEIIHVRISPEGVPCLQSSYPAPGLSRSSVAIGRTRHGQTWEVLVAQWGGDPTQLNGTGQGSFAVLPIDNEGRLGKPHTVNAGVNPTDIITGDLDGDGLDEVAVLNFGNGLGIADRSESGGIDIYKWRGESYDLVATFNVPSPRIGLIADVDGDGQLELAVTAFYEKRLVIIKYLR